MPRDRSLVFDEDGEEDDVVQNFEDIKKNLLSTLDSEIKLDQDHVKVYLRVRPLKKEERDKHEDQVIRVSTGPSKPTLRVLIFLYSIEL